MVKRIILATECVLLLGWASFLMIPEEPELPVSPVAESAVAPTSSTRKEQALPEPTPVSIQSPIELPVAQSVSQPQPLGPKRRKALGELLNTSSEGLVVETRNGVSSVDLQGRFRTVPVATIDANGNIHIRDYSCLPKEHPTA